MLRQTALLIASLAYITTVAAEPVLGTWQTVPDDNGNYGHVLVQPCEDAICGELIQSFAKDGSVLESENIGKNIIWDMQPKGDGKYAGGKIWSPDRDKTYKSKMELVNEGQGLAVEGCILFICRDGGTWKRVN